LFSKSAELFPSRPDANRETGGSDPLRSGLPEPDILDLLAGARTPTEAAKILRCSVGSAWRYILDGRLASFKVGGKRLIPLDAIRAFVQGGNDPVQTPPAPRTEAERHRDSEAAMDRCRQLGV
jgi:excisionase family DNA binding protein